MAARVSAREEQIERESAHVPVREKRRGSRQFSFFFPKGKEGGALNRYIWRW